MRSFLKSIFNFNASKADSAGGGDIVVELTDVPQSDIGAPLPIVLSSEHNVLLAFRCQNTPEGWDGSSVRVVNYDTANDPLAIVELGHCHSFTFGAPNDEAFNGHPLYEKGLHPYGVFEVRNSSWLRTMEQRNSVHLYHKPDRFYGRYKHFVFAFHDSTFECLAEGFKCEVVEGSLEGMLPEMQRRLFERT